MVVMQQNLGTDRLKYNTCFADCSTIHVCLCSAIYNYVGAVVRLRTPNDPFALPQYKLLKVYVTV